MQQNLRKFNFPLDPKTNITDLNRKKFECFLKKLKEIISSCKRLKEITKIEQNSKPDQSSEINQEDFLVEPDYDKEKKRITFRILISSSIYTDKLKEKLENLENQFHDCFKYNGGDENAILEEYFSHFSDVLIEMLKNNKEIPFFEEIKLIEDTVKQSRLEEFGEKNLTSVLRCIGQLQSTDYEKFMREEHREKVYGLWESIFHSLRKTKKLSMIVRHATKILIDGIKKKFWPKYGTNRIDRYLTSFFFYKFSDPNEISQEFINGYIDELASQAIKEIQDGDEEITKRIIQFIDYIKIDIEESRDYNQNKEINEDQKKLYIETYHICQLRIMLLSAYQVDKDKSHERSLELIDKNRFLLTLQCCFTDKSEWNSPFFHENHLQDRTGRSSSSFNPYGFWKKFLIFFFEKNGDDFLKGQSSDDSIYILLCMTKGELKGDFKNLDGIIKKLKKTMDENIIQNPLSDNKIKSFITQFEQDYKKEAKISDSIEVTKDSSESDQESDDVYGLYTTEPREYFIKSNTPSVILNMNIFVQAIARGENSFIVKEINEKMYKEEVSLDFFFKEKLSDLCEEGNDYSFFTNILFYDWGTIFLKNSKIKSSALDIDDLKIEGQFKEINFSSQKYKFDTKITHINTNDSDNFDFILAIKRNCLQINYSRLPLQNDKYKKYEKNDVLDNRFYINFEDWATDGLPESEKKKFDCSQIGLKILSKLYLKNLGKKDDIKLFVIK